MTAIEWTDATWNPTRGCSRVSPGCDNCYAMSEARRHDHPGGAYEGLTRVRKKDGKVDWSGRVRSVEAKLLEPLRWKKPHLVFVDSMSDLFHEQLSDDQIDRVFAVMALARRHTFQVLTKRAGRLPRYFAVDREQRIGAAALRIARSVGIDWDYEWRKWDRETDAGSRPRPPRWPLPNVWLGVSVEDQERAEERIPHLLATPAAVRFVSAEPLLGPLDLSIYLYRGVTEAKPGDADYDALNWVIVGGENGPRQCAVEWIRGVVRQCRAAGVACFVKQLGARYVDAVQGVGGARAHPDPLVVPHIRRLRHRKGGDPAEWPKDLRVRQWPVPWWSRAS